MIPSGIAGKPLFAMTKKLIAVLGATGAQGDGLVRAILHDSAGEFVRANTRHTSSVKAQEPARLGAKVVEADLDDPPSVRRAMKGTYGAYCATFFREHFSPEKKLAETRHFPNSLFPPML